MNLMRPELMCPESGEVGAIGLPDVTLAIVCVLCPAREAVV